VKYWIIGVEAAEAGLKAFFQGPFPSAYKAIQTALPRDMETKWCLVSAEDNIKARDIGPMARSIKFIPDDITTFADLQTIIEPYNLNEPLPSASVPHLRKK
jgi:hypothetical protein